MSEAVVLLVEGRNAGSQSLESALVEAGYELHLAHTAKTALKIIVQHPPDLVVFDSSTMRSSGTRSCRRLRKAVEGCPIIHCRAEGVSEDSSCEADLYLVYPFTPRKLLNRVRALIPANDLKEEVVRYGPITFYRSKRSVDFNGKGECRLTPKLWQLLDEFIRHPNQIISRRRLMHDVWQTDYIGDTRTLDVHIRWLRELVEVDPANPQILRTVRRKGYIFSIEKEA